jgi:gluconolactonase
MEQDGCYVYRVDPKTGEVRVVADDFTKPNGLAFSPDESILYIADSARSHDPDFPTPIRAFRVGTDDSLSGGEVFCETTKGLPDGFRLDTDGNVWTSAGPAVEVFAPSGDMLGRLNFPQTVANVVFGGPKRNRLFVCCTFAVYSVYVAATGIQRP